MSISTKEELQFLLHRGLEIEKKFESISAWECFVTVDSDNWKTVLSLARDSHKYRLDLEKLLETLNLEAATNEIPDATFDFGGHAWRGDAPKNCYTGRDSRGFVHWISRRRLTESLLQLCLVWKTLNFSIKHLSILLRMKKGICEWWMLLRVP